MASPYSEWIPNRAGVCPVHPQMLVQCLMTTGEPVGPVPAGQAEWALDHPDPITHYRFPMWEAMRELVQIVLIHRPVEPR